MQKREPLNQKGLCIECGTCSQNANIWENNFSPRLQRLILQKITNYLEINKLGQCAAR